MCFCFLFLNNSIKSNLEIKQVKRLVCFGEASMEGGKWWRGTRVNSEHVTATKEKQLRCLHLCFFGWVGCLTCAAISSLIFIFKLFWPGIWLAMEYGEDFHRDMFKLVSCREAEGFVTELSSPRFVRLRTIQWLCPRCGLQHIDCDLGCLV